jgi:hypothetical protein
VQEDPGRDRYVEGLDPGSEADADAPVGGTLESRSDARAFIPHHQQYRRTLRRS